MATLICPAPAKLNLFLHITGRRTDGYHLLQTAFVFLDYADDLSFELRLDGEIVLTTSLANVAMQDNLIFKAAHLLQQHTRVVLGVNIGLQKRIPMGGGLGGGSSDAATTLLALNQLWQLKLSLAELATLGLQLGADVPIFIRGEAAWAEGVGEQFQSISIPENWYLVIIPPCEVKTAEIFSHSELTRDTQAIKIHDFYDGRVHNDFEPLVKKLYPEVAAAFDWLEQYTTAFLTGTGACIFGKFVEQQQAVKIANMIPQPFSGFVTQGLNHSPAHCVLSSKSNWGVAKR